MAAIICCTGGTPFYVHEVIDQGGEPIKVQEYFGVGRVTEFRYGIKVCFHCFFHHHLFISIFTLPVNI
jgi:hypothetical protein